jgi:hypothetical protein
MWERGGPTSCCRRAGEYATSRPEPGRLCSCRRVRCRFRRGDPPPPRSAPLQIGAARVLLDHPSPPRARRPTPFRRASPRRRDRRRAPPRFSRQAVAGTVPGAPRTPPLYLHGQRTRCRGTRHPSRCPRSHPRLHPRGRRMRRRGTASVRHAACAGRVPPPPQPARGPQRPAPSSSRGERRGVNGSIAGVRASPRSAVCSLRPRPAPGACLALHQLPRRAGDRPPPKTGHRPPRPAARGHGRPW